MNIFISVSHLFYKYCINLLDSLYFYNKDITLYIGNLGLTKEEIKFLEIKLKAKILEFPKKYYKGIKKTNWPTEYLLKLCLPWVLKSVDRILCLGSDMLVSGDLSNFYKIDLGGYSFAASIEDCGNFTERFKLFNSLPSDKVYVNTEMMLMNLKHIREKYNIDDIFRNFVKYQDYFLYFDQDFLNYTFYNQIKVVSKNFNFQIDENFGSSTFYMGLKHSSILHFSSSPKPWSWKSKGAYIVLYRKYLIKNKNLYTKIYIKHLFCYWIYYFANKIKRFINKIKGRL